MLYTWSSTHLSWLQVSPLHLRNASELSLRHRAFGIGGKNGPMCLQNGRQFQLMGAVPSIATSCSLRMLPFSKPSNCKMASCLRSRVERDSMLAMRPRTRWNIWSMTKYFIYFHSGVSQKWDTRMEITQLYFHDRHPSSLLSTAGSNR